MEVEAPLRGETSTTLSSVHHCATLKLCYECLVAFQVNQRQNRRSEFTIIQ